MSIPGRDWLPPNSFRPKFPRVYWSSCRRCGKLSPRPLKIETYLLLALLIFGIFKTHRSVRRSQSAEERFFAIRASAFTWLVGIVLLVAFLFLPNKQRILFLLPAFVVVISLVQFWKNARTRLRRENQERMDLERMKRVN